MNPWLVRNATYPLFQMYVGERVLDRLQDLNQTQWYSREQLEALQWRRLERLLLHCYENVPYYRTIFDQLGMQPQDVRNMDDFRRLPVLTKTVLRSDTSALVARDRERRSRRLVTSGSTGTPVQVQLSREANSHRLAAQARGWGWWGWEIGTRTAWIWSPAASPGGREGLKALKRRCVDNALHFSVHDLSAEAMREFYHRLRSFRPRFMYGYTSSTYEFARFLRDEGLDGRAIGLEGVCTSCEVLYPHQRQAIEEVFGCSLFDEYGCCEVGVIGIQCPEGNMHLASENVLVEFLVDGRPAEPGQRAQVVITGLNEYHLPLVRYSLGDVGSYTEAACSCGRGLPLMEISVGRELDMIRLKDGRRLHPQIVLQLEEGILMEAVQKYKIVQQRLDHFFIQIEATSGSEDAIAEAFPALFKRRLGEDVSVECEFVPQIPREPSGKLRYFVSALGSS